MTLSLTPRANDLLRYIEGFLAANNGVGPTRREMADAIGEKSVSGAQRLFDQLEERGLIRRLPNRGRALEIVQGQTVSLTPDLYLAAHASAKRGGTTVNALVATAVRTWLDTA